MEICTETKQGAAERVEGGEGVQGAWGVASHTRTGGGEVHFRNTSPYPALRRSPQAAASNVVSPHQRLGARPAHIITQLSEKALSSPCSPVASPLLPGAARSSGKMVSREGTPVPTTEGLGLQGAAANADDVADARKTPPVAARVGVAADCERWPAPCSRP